MGTINEYRCSKCDYSAQVSGGTDCGFEVYTKTVYCGDCAELVDVVTAFTDSESKHIGYDAEIGLCPECCKGKHLADWNDGDPCPKCRGKMEEGDYKMMWD